MDPADAFFTSGPLPHLHIEIDPHLLKSLDANPKTPVRAMVRETVGKVEQIVYCDVAVHLKGGPGSFRQTNDKPALTLTFAHFVPGQSFHGLNKIHLNNSVQDGSYMCEYLGSYVFRESGCPAPRVSNARVWLNGRDLGPFVLKEGFDGVFFRKWFRDKSGNLYEGSFTDVDGNLPIHFGQDPPEPRDPFDKAQIKAHERAVAEQRKAGEARLRSLADAARDPDPLKRRQRVDEVLDADRFLTFLACESMVAHWDGYGGNRNNYRIYDDPRGGRLVFLPQGMDQLFQRPDYSLFTNASLMGQVLTTQSPEDRQRYIERIARIRQTVFTPEALLAQLDHVSGRLAPLMAEFGPGMLRHHKEETAGLRQRLLERIANIDRQLANPPKPLQFDSNGLALFSPDQWQPKQQEGNADADKVGPDARPRLFRVTCKPPGGAASWRTTVLLPQGRYTFEGRVKTIGVKPPPPGQNTAAGLRISGEKRTTRIFGDTDWQTIRYDFQVDEALREVVLVCDCAAEKGQTLFDPATLRLKRR